MSSLGCTSASSSSRHSLRFFVVLPRLSLRQRREKEREGERKGGVGGKRRNRLDCRKAQRAREIKIKESVVARLCGGFCHSDNSEFSQQKGISHKPQMNVAEPNKKNKIRYFPSLSRVPFLINRKEKDEHAGEKYKKIAYPSLSNPLGSLANIIVRTEKLQSNNLTGFSVRSRRKRASTQSREN